MAKRKFDRDEWMDESRYASTLEERKAIFDAATNTCSHWWNYWTHNIDANAAAGRLAKEHSIVSDYGSQNGPVLIVGAGPSFFNNLELIRGIAEHVKVIAVDRTYKPLKQMGVTPFLTVSADAQEETLRFFEGVKIGVSEKFALSVVSHPSLWECVERQSDYVRYYGNINPFAPWWNLAAQRYGDHILTTSSGAVVTHSAVDIAYWMGFDNIITIGNDLCYPTKKAAKLDTGGHDVIRVNGKQTIRTFEHAARGFALLRKMYKDVELADCSGGLERGWDKRHPKELMDLVA